MVKIRLLRAGSKRRPYYRVIAVDERKPRDTRALEFLGTYNPVAHPPEIRLKAERIEDWRARGAQLTQAVRGLVRRARRLPAPTPEQGATAVEPPAGGTGGGAGAPAAAGEGAAEGGSA